MKMVSGYNRSIGVGSVDCDIVTPFFPSQQHFHDVVSNRLRRFQLSANLLMSNLGIAFFKLAQWHIWTIVHRCIPFWLVSRDSILHVQSAYKLFVDDGIDKL